MMRSARAAALVVAVALGGVAALSVSRDLAAAPPAGKEVAEVLVSGNKVRNSQDIIAVFGLRPEQKYEEDAIRAGTEKLYDKGWFTPNGIEVRTVERTDGRINVILYVTELTNFIEEIKYNGAQHISTDELAKLTGLRIRMPMSPHLNQQARLNILRKYQEDGRVHASVTLREGTKLDDRRVVFDIVEGPRVKISDVDFVFVGKHESGISSGRLREQLTISRAKLGGLIGGDYHPGQIDSRRQGPDPVLPRPRVPGLPGRPGGRPDRRPAVRERHLLRGRGRPVQGRQGADQRQQRVPRGEAARVHGPAGERVLRPGQDRRRPEAHAATCTGTPAARSSLREEHPEPAVNSGIVHVHYEITESQPYRVGEVIIQGNTVTQDRVIRRELPFYSGQLLSFPDVAVAQQNLSRLGIFKEDPAQGIRPSVEVMEPDRATRRSATCWYGPGGPDGQLLVGAGSTRTPG